MTIASERFTLFEIDRTDQIDYGRAISFGERALALTHLADMYAEYAEAKGLESYASTPAGRRKLKEKYGDSYMDIVNVKMAKAKKALAQEDDYIEPLMKREGMVAAGFDSSDIDEDAQMIKFQLRRKIGVSVGSAARNDFLRSLYNPE